MSSDELMALVLEKHKDQGDDFVISIGHWVSMPDELIPPGLPRGVLREFRADFRVTIGEIKQMLKKQ